MGSSDGKFSILLWVYGIQNNKVWFQSVPYIKDNTDSDGDPFIKKMYEGSLTEANG